MAKKKPANPIPFFILFVTFLAVLGGFLYNSWGQFTDVRGFYGMRYIYGDHPWPFSDYVRPNDQGVVGPVEYPALTGLLLWILTFFVPSGGDVTLKYYYLNVFVNGFTFLFSIVILLKLVKRQYAYLLILAPAVITALNRNWDIWAVLPLLGTIYFFEKQKWRASSFLLGIAIATKFFPLVLLLPIVIFFKRDKKYGEAVLYVLLSFSTWLAINIPILIVDPNGWAYFYKLSFSRGLSDGSIFDILSNFGLTAFSQNSVYYFCNVVVFSALIVFLLKSKTSLTLAQSAFLAMFAFTLFGKQYSMQYVLWIAPLAVIGIAMARRTHRRKLAVSYIVWQVTEMLFHHAYYQNLLARVLKSRGSPLTEFWSDAEYSLVGLVRYLALTVFTALYVISFKSERGSFSDGISRKGSATKAHVKSHK